MNRIATIAALLLAWPCCAQEPESATVELPTKKAFDQLRKEQDNKIADAQSAADAANLKSTKALDTILGIDETLQKLKPIAPAPLVLDVTRDTPLGEHKPGSDITGVLQWALDTLHEHRLPIVIPAGDWTISKTVTTPYRSGLTLIGAGQGRDTAGSKWLGARTAIKWTGEPGGVMFRVQTSHGTIGNFTLVGNGADKGERGIVVSKPYAGLAVGNLSVLPIMGYDLGTVVQCGESLGMGNCDNLHFEWLSATRCGRAYHGVNLQGMDHLFERLSLMNTPIGIEMDGGGCVYVLSGSSHGGTLLKINNTSGKGVGKHNGVFRLSNIKVDLQSGDAFTLVDCAEPYPIRIVADGGMLSNDKYNGTFARLSGGNHLEVRDWTSTFIKITGAPHRTHGRPTVMLRGCRIWGDGSKIFEGTLSARVRDCVTGVYGGQTEWVDFDWINGEVVEK